MQLLSECGEQPVVYPPDIRLCDAVRIQHGAVRNQGARAVRRFPVRIDQAVKRYLPCFLCQVRVFKQPDGIIVEILTGRCQCRRIIQQDYLFVFQPRYNVRYAASCQQQVALVYPAAIVGFLPLFQLPVFQDGRVILNQAEPVPLAFDDQKRIHVFHTFHLVLPAGALVGHPRFMGEDNPRIVFEQGQAAGCLHTLCGVVPYIFTGHVLHPCEAVYRSAGDQADDASA